MILAQITQTVTLNGSAIRVRDCSVSKSASERVGKIGFAVERSVVGDVVFGNISPGQPVTVAHTDGTTTLTHYGLIERIDLERVGTADMMRVHCVTQERLAQHRRLLREWQDATVGEIITDAWGQAAELGVTLNGVQVNNTPVESFSMQFDTLHDLMEQMSQLTGWVWSIEAMDLKFYDPQTVQGPTITESVGSSEVALSRDSSGVVNRARMQAYEYLNVGVSFRACEGFVQLPIRPVGWELSEELPDGFGFSAETMQVTAQTDGTAKTLTARLRRPVWVVRSDAASIATFGVRETSAPLWHDGGIDVAGATQKLDAFLRDHAWESVSGSVEPTNFGHRPNTVSAISLRGVVRDVLVDQVDWTMDGTDLQVSLSFFTANNFRRPGKDAVIDIGRRVERIERAASHSGGTLALVTQEIGVIGGISTVTGEWGWNGEFEAEQAGFVLYADRVVFQEAA